jgi:transcriptional regulator with XRE-family HTH domain
MAKKLGELIKQARTGAGLTQEQLAKKVDGVTASDISKAERGEKELSQAALRQIAKATGVTQTSLLEAAKGGKSGSSGKKPAASSGKAASGTSVKVTASEKKLLELYRKADADTKKAALRILSGEQGEGLGGMISSLLDGAIDLIAKK